MALATLALARLATGGITPLALDAIGALSIDKEPTRVAGLARHLVPLLHARRATGDRLAVAFAAIRQDTVNTFHGVVGHRDWLALHLTAIGLAAAYIVGDVDVATAFARGGTGRWLAAGARNVARLHAVSLSREAVVVAIAALK